MRRRALLLSAAGAALGLAGCGRGGDRRQAPATTAAAPPPAPGSTASTAPRGAPVVAIVGAGLAGLACANGLVGTGLDVRVYEARTRVGGRVWSVRGLPDGQVAERGGEFVDSRHTGLQRLVKELGLELDDRWAGLPVGAEEVARLGGRDVPWTALDSAWDEARAAVGVDVDAAYSGGAAMFALDERSAAEWIDERIPGGRRGSLGAYLGAWVTAEFGLDAADQSALNIVYGLAGSLDGELLGDADGADERYHVRGGSDGVASGLAARLPAGSVELDTPLLALRRRSDRRYRLSLAAGREVDADLVVLAAPFPALRAVDLAGAELGDDTLAAIAGLGMGTNSKVGLRTRTRAWQAAGRSGASLADDATPGGPWSTWDATLGQPGEAGVALLYRGGRAGADGGAPGRGAHDDPTPEELRALARAVDPVLPGLAAAADGHGFRSVWALDPWAGGSYACPRPGEVSRLAGVGARRGNVLFAGEHVALGSTGYMDSAVQSGVDAAATVRLATGVG